MTCPSKRRDIVFDGLAECPENEWLEFAEAYRFVHATGHRLADNRENPSFLYIADAHYGSIYDSVAVDRQYLRRCFGIARNVRHGRRRLRLSALSLA